MIELSEVLSVASRWLIDGDGPMLNDLSNPEGNSLREPERVYGSNSVASLEDDGASIARSRAFDRAKRGQALNTDEHIHEVLEEIRVRLMQLHHSGNANIRAKWLKEAHSRIDEYNDWIILNFENQP